MLQRPSVIGFCALMLAAVASAQSIFTIAGGGTDDGRPALQAGLNRPLGIAIDAAGDVYFADWKNFRIRRVSASTGLITTVAGNGSAGFTGDGGPATQASLDEPVAVAVDSAGNLYIADMINDRIRKVDAVTKNITTFAGMASSGFGGDGGPATSARLSFPSHVTIAPSGDLYIADAANNRIRKVTMSTGIITTVAGSGNYGFAGDGGQATAASLQLAGDAPNKIVVGNPPNVVVDQSNNLYISDTYSHRIRRVDGATGVITTIAGTGTAGFSGDGGPASGAALNTPTGLAVESGNLFITDSRNARIRRIALSGGTITTYAGNGTATFGGDGGPATGASFAFPNGLGIRGDLLVADTANDRVRRIAAGSTTVSAVAGSGVPFSGDGGSALSAQVLGPSALVMEPSGSILISEYNGHRVRRLGTDGKISTIAGVGRSGGSGDGGPATQALLRDPAGVVRDAAGNIYFADLSSNRVRRISPDGTITTFAGTGTRGFSGDNGPPTSANLNLAAPADSTASLFVGFPSGLAFDSAGDLYIADTYNYRIRKVNVRTNIITTIAGSGSPGFSGDGGPATSAQFATPTGIAIDRNDLFVADTGNDRVRKIDLVSGAITTVAGSSPGFGGDGGPATAARLNRPTGVAVDLNGTGTFYIADKINDRIRKVSGGIISTVAGSTTTGGFTGDGGPATAAGLTEPYGVFVDRRNSIFIADTESNRVRVVLACVNVAAPQLTSPNNGATGVATSPTLSWNAVANAFRYDVYLSPNNPPSLIANDLTATSFAPSNLTPGLTYFWRIVAKGDQFCSPAATNTSEVRSFTVAAGCGAPGTFNLTQPSQGATGVSPNVQLMWQSASGAQNYDVFFGAANPPPLLRSSVNATSFNVNNLIASTTYFWSVVAHAACDASKVTTTATGSFRTAGACAGAGAFTLRTPSDGASGVPTTTTIEWNPSPNASSYDLFLGTTSNPGAYLLDVTSTAVAVSGLTPATRYFVRVVAKVSCDSSRIQTTPVRSFTTAGACPSPGTTSIAFVPPGNVGVGQTYMVAWSEAQGLDAAGGYIIERSLNSSFNGLVDSQETFSTSASFVSNSAGTYYHRVRALSGCNPSAFGPYSDSRQVNVITGTANVVFTVQPLAVISPVGEKLEDKRARFTLENIGTNPLQVILGKGEISSVPFFTIIDPSGGDSVFVTLDPRKPKSFDVQFSGPANDRAASYQGIVFVAATGQGLAITPYAFVNLKVGGTTAARPVFLSNGRQTEYTFFPGFSGDDTNRPQITIDIRNDGTAPMELGAEIGPEVWMVPEAGWNTQPIPPGATRSVRLRTQRNRAPNGSALPRYTYFTVRTRNGETARLLVQDNDALPTAAGRTSLLDAGSRSYVVPGVISATLPNGASTFTRLRLTNVGSDAVQTDLFFTPAGSDGFDAGAVKRATVLIPPNDAVTLTDPLVQVFGLSPPVQGQIEVRAALERIGFLIVNPSVLTPVNNGGAFSYTLPTFRLGEGARVGSSHLISGINVGTGLRTTLIVTETSGNDRMSVRAALIDTQGNRRGETTLDVPRYGQRSVDVASLTGGGAVDGARIELNVDSGGGSAAGLVTMLDSEQNGGASLISGPSGGTTGTSVFARRGSRVSADGAAAIAIVPVVLRGPAPSNPSVTLKTSMGFSISGNTRISAVVTYRPNTGGPPMERTIEVSPRVVLRYDDVLGQLFGISSNTLQNGAIFIRDLPGAQIFGQLLTSTNRVVGSLPLFTSISEVLSSLQSRKPLYLDGLEQSVDSTRGTRWAVRINETSGASGTVRMRLYEAGNRSLPIAEKSFPIAANGQLDMDSIFSVLDLDTDDRRKDRTGVLAVATVESGSAVISAVGTATDNRTGDIKHVVFSPNGGVPATGVLKISLVTAKSAPPTQTPVAGPRRRGVRH